MKKHAIAITLLGAVFALILAETSWPQNRELDRNSTRSILGKHPAYGGQPGASDGTLSEEASAATEVSRLVNELRGTEDGAKKGDLTKQLEAAIAKQFDRDMESRRDELSKLEERLNKLRTQLDRRRAAKADIIQLELKVLVNEAEGLGFSSQSSSNRYSTQQEYYNKFNPALHTNTSSTPSATPAERKK